MTNPARPGEALQDHTAGISSAIASPTLDAVLPRITRGLYIGGSGNVVVQFAGDAATTTLVGLAAGVWHPMQIQLIASSGTTATGIVVGF